MRVRLLIEPVKVRDLCAGDLFSFAISKSEEQWNEIADSHNYIGGSIILRTNGKGDPRLDGETPAVRITPIIQPDDNQ